MTQLSEIKDDLIDMLTTIRELEKVENYKGADYTEVIIDIKWSHQQCKGRLKTLRGKQE